MDALLWWLNYSASCFPAIDIKFLSNSLTSFAHAFSLGEVVTFEQSGKRVRIVRQLESGGTADVFLVEEDLPSGPAQKFALKKMQCSSDEQLSQATAEIELMQRGIHPGLVKLIDSKITRHAGQPRSNTTTGVATAWILMPFYREGTVWDVVHSRLKAHSSLSPGETLSILRQVVAALEAMHDLGLVHRDVKPQNVLLERVRPLAPAAQLLEPKAAARQPGPADAWQCALTDFGSSCTTSSLEVKTFLQASRVLEDSERMCSPLYRPPELYDVPTPSSLDGRIDIWAVGCLLYFMLMGESPFESALSKGASMVLAVHRARINWETPPAPLNPDLVELANACLRPNFTERPNSHELCERIQQLCEQFTRNGMM